MPHWISRAIPKLPLSIISMHHEPAAPGVVSAQYEPAALKSLETNYNRTSFLRRIKLWAENITLNEANLPRFIYCQQIFICCQQSLNCDGMSHSSWPLRDPQYALPRFNEWFESQNVFSYVHFGLSIYPDHFQFQKKSFPFQHRPFSMFSHLFIQSCELYYCPLLTDF